MTKVTLQRLSKVYPGGVRAVDAVDLEVESGEFVVLVGPSGCGKSTTLRMVAGLEEISGGTLTIGDRVVNEVPARDRDIAMVFQSYALYPHLTVSENLAFGLERRRTHRSLLRRLLSRDYRGAAQREAEEVRAKVQRAAATLGIEPLLRRKPGALSGGQRQRVAVGRALVREPKVFLFDEPLSNLDAKLRVEMRAEIKELHRKTGATMLYVTHDQEEAMTLGDRLVVMRDGVVQQCASPREVYARPANRFVAEFVGTPAMNFITGRVELSGADARFDSPAGSFDLPPELARAAQASGPWHLGVRPDTLRVAPAGGASDERAAGAPGQASASVTLDAELRLVEDLGDRVDLRLVLRDGSRWIARRPSSERPALGAVSVVLDLGAAHLFKD
ncbi:MAG: ATP-binding cassette domain-containing protein [Planctomycetota bacterium]